MSTGYPFDPDVRKRLTEALFALLPALYRVRDLPESVTFPTKIPGKAEDGELYRFLRVLAAPLAETRQNIDELYADLFIDTSADWVLPYLAEMVGTRLVFPDAPSNRRDVRGTVGWRRRKGTPAMLEEMGTELSEHAVTLKEGWKLCLLAQDLDLVRPERTVVGIRPAVVAEQGSGPLDVLSHAIDGRRISGAVPPGTGKYHPKHLAHYTFPTELFPLKGGEPVERTQVGDPDLRFAFDPLDHEKALRVRGARFETTGARRPRTPARGARLDRVPPMHFAANPGDSFDQTGASVTRFSVKILGLAAGIAAPLSEERTASRIPVGRALADKPVNMIRLAHPTEKWQSRIAIEVLDVPHAVGVPNLAGAEVRGTLTLDAGTAVFAAGSATPIVGDVVTMLRLKPVGVSAAYFPGATLEIAGTADDSRMASENLGLAALGFLRGALVVEVPALWIFKTPAGPNPGEKHLYVAADGGLIDAEIPGDPPTIAPLVPAGGGQYLLPGALLAAGPGPAWPPLPPTASLDRWIDVPCSEGSGPCVIHGGKALKKAGLALVAAPGGVKLGLVFATRVGNVIEPFLRLDVNGPDPTLASSSSVLLANGAVVSGPAARARLLAIANRAVEDRDALEVLVRLESDTADIVLPPCEMAFSGPTGRALLIHLPALDTDPPTVVDWPLSVGLTQRGDAAVVADDGATYLPNSPQVLRFAHGPIAPIREAASHRRRRVRQRSLCPWKHETMLQKLDPTPEGWLDIDPSAGLFSLAKTEPPPARTAVLTALVPGPSLTIDLQDGYSAAIGARPDAREPWLDVRLAAPTRIIARFGHHEGAASPAYHSVPIYASLKAALDGIIADPSPQKHEVIAFQDSATYIEKDLAWPTNIEAITIQAAERERPVVELEDPWPKGAASYDALTVIGILFSQGSHSIAFPQAEVVRIAFVTAMGANAAWTFEQGTKKEASLSIVRSIAAGIQVSGGVNVSLSDCVVDTRAPLGLFAVDAELTIERTTVEVDGPTGFVGVEVLILEASECLFDTNVIARDRFRGCIRYSRVGDPSALPRRHRVVTDTPIFVTRDRHDPAHLRLSERCPAAILRGAEDGAEIGAFHDVRLVQRTEALGRRLMEYTPAGLVTGLLRMD